MTFVARVRTTPEAAAPRLRSTLVAMDRDQPVYGVTSLDGAIAATVAGRRFTMWLMSLFAGIALLLASVGLYATLSFAIVRRTREIGIRMALGARRADILRLVAGEGLLAIGAGTLAGIALSLAIVGRLRSLLFGIGPADPVTFVSTLVLLIAVALLASVVPARRATTIDPAKTIRTS
jgi:putative ABC transport system permease protein